MGRLTTKMLPSKSPEEVRRRWTTPLYKFLEGILSPVDDALIYDDDHLIDAKIYELNKAQENESYLIGQQTHIIRS